MDIGHSLPIPRDFAPTQLPEMGGPNSIPGQLTVDEMRLMAPQMKGPQIWAPLERPQLTPEEMMRLQQMLLEQRSRGLLGE